MSITKIIPMKTEKLLSALLCVFTLWSMQSCSKKTENGLDPGNSGTVANGSLKANVSAFKVIGYLPDWGDVNSVQYSKLTHINYAFVLPNTNGSLAIGNPAVLSAMVTAAHKNSVKALAAIGGGDGSANFVVLAANAQVRTTFVNAVMAMVAAYNLDGVDIDWEYPVKNVSDANYANLMQELSTALHAKGKLLSTAVTGSYGDYILPRVFGYIDFMNIMAYDEAPVDHSTLDIATRSLAHWIGLGLSPAKAILGVPFYGRSVDNALTYADLISQGANPNNDNFNGFGYNGKVTISNKAQLVINQNAGGMMIWQLAGDATGTNSLLSVISLKLLGK